MGFTRRPFVSHGKPISISTPEGQKTIRPEVQIITGVADFRVKDNTDKAINYDFKADNVDYPVTGRTPKDSDVHKFLEKCASEGNVEVEFRIERVRQSHIDPTWTVDEILRKRKAGELEANKTFHRNLTAVRLTDEDAEWVINKEHSQTRLDEDPVSNDRSIYDYSTEELKGKNTPPAPTSSHSHGGTPPFKSRNNDGSMNTGSFGVSSGIYIYSTIQKEFEDLSDGDCLKVASALYAVINKLQATFARMDAPNPNEPTHQRAREAVFAAIHGENVFPELVNNDEKFREWISRIGSKAGKLWKWAIMEAEKVA